MVEYNPKYSEIFKLDTMLTEAGIQHDFLDEGFDGANKRLYRYHIYYPSKVIWQSDDRDFCFVAEGDFSYGGDENLLEIIGLLTPEEREYYLDDVIGSLTAEDVFARIKKAEDRRRKEA